MTTQGKFYITTKNGRQRSLWLHLFGTDILPVTSAFPQEVFYTDGRSQMVYTLDTAALGDHACRRLAAHLAARRWGTTFEIAMAEVRQGWPINAADCQLATAEELTTSSAVKSTAAWQNSPAAAPKTTARSTAPKNGRAPRPRQKSRKRQAYGRAATGAISHQLGLGLP
ncbi:MAG: hypothetical protein R3D55_11815 [Chloroflexota bacterium]